MKNSHIIYALLILFALGIAGFFLTQVETQTAEEIPNIVDKTPGENGNGGRVMSIESYVTQNISTLSPEKEVLGGTFYVTEIEAENGSGVVKYEDGHNAFIADFTYTADPEKGIDITSFIVRSQ